MDNGIPSRPFKRFQIRWAEKMGDPKDPYLIRWMLIFNNYSIRLHKWIRSDDSRFFHDHACDLISIVIKGSYDNVTPNGRFHVQAPSIWSAKAEKRHWLDIPPTGAWTLLLCGKPYLKWGFYIGERKFRPLRYFHTYGGSAVNLMPRNKP